jgi:hypothetical protein
MTTIDRHEMLTIWRRRLFIFWIVVSAAIALFAIIGGPLLSTDGSDETRWVALLSPLAMALFVLSGVAWLVLLIASHRRH